MHFKKVPECVAIFTAKMEVCKPNKEDFKHVPKCEAIVMTKWDMIKARYRSLLFQVGGHLISANPEKTTAGTSAACRVTCTGPM